MADEDMELEFLRMAALRSMQSKAQPRTSENPSNSNPIQNVRSTPIISNHPSNRTTPSNLGKSYDRPSNNYSNSNAIRSNYQNPMRMSNGSYRGAEQRPHRDTYNRTPNRMASPNKNSYQPNMMDGNRRSINHNRTRNSNQLNVPKDWETFEFNLAPRSNLIVLTSEKKEAPPTKPIDSLVGHSRPNSNRMSNPSRPGMFQMDDKRDEERLPSRFQRIERDSDSDDDDDDDDDEEDEPKAKKEEDDRNAAKRPATIIHHSDSESDSIAVKSQSDDEQPNSVESSASFGKTTSLPPDTDPSDSAIAETSTSCELKSSSLECAELTFNTSSSIFNVSTPGPCEPTVEPSQKEAQNDTNGAQVQFVEHQESNVNRIERSASKQTDHVDSSDENDDNGSTSNHSDSRPSNERNVAQRLGSHIMSRIETVDSRDRSDRTRTTKGSLQRRADGRLRTDSRHHGHSSDSHDGRSQRGETHHSNRHESSVQRRLNGYSDQSAAHQRDSHSRHSSNAKRPRRDTSDREEKYQSDSSNGSNSQSTGRRLRSCIVRT
jgi:hypothetical protein